MYDCHHDADDKAESSIVKRYKAPYRAEYPMVRGVIVNTCRWCKEGADDDEF